MTISSLVSDNLNLDKGAILTVTAITQLLRDTGTSFQQEMKSKQASIDAVHSNLRTTSSQLGDARRELEHLTATMKKQSLARQRVANLSHAREDEQVRLMQEQSRTSSIAESSVSQDDEGFGCEVRDCSCIRRTCSSSRA